MTELKLKRVQYTRYDQERLNPEIAFDKEYLEDETIKTGLSEEVCSFGYKLNEKWIKIKEAKNLLTVCTWTTTI